MVASFESFKNLQNYNGDDKADIFWVDFITGQPAGVTLMDGTTIAAKATLPRLSNDWGPPVTVGDTNGDGKTDLFWRNNRTGENVMWLMNGTTVAGAAALPGLPVDWEFYFSGDYNGDGKKDFFWHNDKTGENAIWLINGTTVTGAAALPRLSDAWAPRGVGDYNGDGKGDVLWRNNKTGENVMWLMNGTTVAGAAALPGLSVNWDTESSGYEDYNGDGKTDIIWRNNKTGENAMWLMNGTTVAGAAALPGLSVNWDTEYGGMGDYNGDGKTDVLWRNKTTGENAMWLMNGTTIAGAGALPPLSNSWSLYSWYADYNGDGKTDLLWQNNITGENAMWLMNGTTVAGAASISRYF